MDSDEAISCLLHQSYRKQLVETVQKALQNGYAGIDIQCLIHQSGRGVELILWQAHYWDSEPIDVGEEWFERYDFRFYDRETLCERLSRGELPAADIRGQLKTER
ncbi:hypothetical protein HAPAU_35900 [Halalkalicoccus paucihalophilus]|uniref:Uncharacterized protein n=1 Tax=Halalkalicoccus paucihalophilus TaxID=1008153 RepID=A0A151AB63_9EURY|nr:hypothetical protein HAPAU_35900 [Halalkalicoccus paucihalophilus]